MKVTVENKEIKPLIANILRINIGQYLKTSNYEHLTLEHNFDEVWDAAKKEIRSRSNVVMIGFDPSGDYEDAMQLILDVLFPQKENFFAFLEITLTGFIEWDKGKTNLAKVFQCLKDLEMPQDQIQRLNKSSRVELLPSPEKSDQSLEFKQDEIKVDKKLCFVIMPFNEKLNPIYDSIIKPVINGLKLKCLRADEIFTSKPIIEDIWENIKKSNFLIADLTDRNPNVFYELGLAHALNKGVILLTQDLSDVPFDLRHYRIIVYKDSISGSEELKSTLNDFITEQIENK